MSIPNNPHIQGAFFKAIGYLDDSKKTVVSVSGGSDSDVVVDFIHQCGFTHKVDYVFFDTGVEYQATYDHLDYLEDRYGIFIQREKAYHSIPYCLKKYGQPFMSKYASECISRLQEAGFTWEDRPFEELIKEYPNSNSAILWWCNLYGSNSFSNIKRKRWLKEFLIENPPKFKIANKCCHYSKKMAATRYYIDNDIDLTIMGLRKQEGGIRAASISKCYNPGRKSKHDNQYIPDKYYPIYWFTDSDKKEYNRFYNICNSDCYTKWGFTRTGCVCCPFGLDLEREREIVKVQEPKLYDLSNKIFGDSYEYTKQFYEFRERMRLKEKIGKNKTLDNWM